ncbi:hypothetical protein ACNJ7E_15495 [Rhodococcus sp. NM-2]|uniref:hypothetical protein n=1 Tax=Rhodococcus TaxID=1827 RepID=UPI0024744F7A|nr:hypothetical protein [Rhodococcus opacus]MDH6285785.1 hypothetical protein [Rhodococcus opacus]
MAACRVVLDACVWLPQTLNNLLLTLADAELFRPVWTPDLRELLGRLTPRFLDAVRALLVDRDDASDRGAVPAVSALPERTGICCRYGRTWIPTSGRYSRRSGCVTTTIR